jgi:hypothetical protein
VHLLETFIRNLIEDARYRKPQVYFSFYFNLKIVRFFRRTLYYDALPYERQIIGSVEETATTKMYASCYPATCVSGFIYISTR